MKKEKPFLSNIKWDKRSLSFILIILVIIFIGFLVRLLPHAPNFTPVGAIALFSAIYLPKKFALVIPIMIMLLSDLIIGFYSWQIMLAVYLSFIFMVGIGLVVKKKKHSFTILGSAILGAIIFFLVTNGAVWAFGSMYAKTFPGLIQCYTMALPFFRNTLTSNLIYTGVLVGGVEYIGYLIKVKKNVPVRVKI